MFILRLNSNVFVDYRYELYALIAHKGISLTSGHYIAYIQAPPNIKGLEPDSWHQEEVCKMCKKMRGSKKRGMSCPSL